MKIPAIIFIIALISCNASRHTNRYEENYSIFGQIEGKDTGKVFLTIYDTTESGPWIIIDSTDIRDSYFHFSGSWEGPAMARIITHIPNPYFEWNFTRYFVLETGTPIRTKLFSNSIASSIFRGSGLNDQLTNFNKEITAMKTRFQSEYFPLNRKGIISDDSLQMLEQRFDQKKYDFIIRQIVKYPNSIVSAFTAAREIIGDDIGTHRLSEIIQAFGEQSDYFTRKLKNELAAMSTTVHTNPGSAIPVFKIRDIHNKAYSDKSLRGEYLFINFWATWCKPCLEEYPLLEDAYVRSRNKPVKFINLSIDFDKEHWVDYIEKLPVGWIEAWVGDNTALQNRFGIRSIPANFLIDRKGKIVAKNIDAYSLVNVIDAYIKTSTENKKGIPGN